MLGAPSRPTPQGAISKGSTMVPGGAGWSDAFVRKGNFRTLPSGTFPPCRQSDLARGREPVRRAQDRVLHFFCYPQRTHQKIYQSLKERRLIAFYAMAREQQDPSADEQAEAGAPECEARNHDAHDDHRNADSVHQFVPWVCVFVVILRHIAVERLHRAPPQASNSIYSRLIAEASHRNPSLMPRH